MVLEHVARGIGRGEYFDVEALEQRPGPEFGGLEPFADRVVHAHRRIRAEPLAHAEHLVQLVVEPRAGRRAAEQVIALRKELPHPAGIGLHRRAVAAWHAQGLERHPVRVQQAQDVVVGLHDEGHWLREGRILGENTRIHVPVG